MERQDLQKSMEKIKAEFLLCVGKFEDVQKHNEMVEAKNEERSVELELKEKDLQKMSSHLDERVNKLEAEKAEAGNLKKLVDADIEKRSQELELKEKELQRLSLDLDERSKMVEADIQKRSQDLKLKEKELQSLSLDLEKSSKIFKKEKAEAGNLKKVVEGDIEKRSQELKVKEEKLRSWSLDLDKRTNFFKKEKAEAGNLKRMVEECTEELRSKRSQLIATMESLPKYQRELGVKDQHLVQVVAQIRRRCKEAREVEDRKREIEEETDGKKKELGLVIDQIEGKMKELGLVIDQIKVSDKQFVTLDEQLESRQRLFNIRSSELASKEKELECVKESIKLSKSDLELKEKKVESLNKCITVCAQEIDSKSKELGGIQKMIEQRNCDLVTKEKRHKEIVETICRSSSEMEEMAKEIKVAEAEANDLNVRSQRFRKENGDKEKKLGLLQKQIESGEEKLIHLKREMEEETGRKKKDLELILSRIGESSKQLDLKSKELGEVQKLIEEERKRLCDMQNQHPSAAEAEPFNEDALMHHESSAYLVCDEVARALRDSPNPVELVLDLVQEYIREGSCLEDSSMEIMVLFFDELAKLQLPNEPQLHLKARQVATLWKGKITIEAPNSTLEALAFLLFIVAYGLKKMINQEETVLLASSIAQYEQAPTLFNSLGLTLVIPEFVKELIKKKQYIPAVRFICLFKLNKESSLSPSELLKEEIIKLRQSALGKRLIGFSQAKDKDAGRLRAILELVADYNLEVDLPGDLVAKLIVQREKSTPLVRCSVMHCTRTSSENQQANSPYPVSAQGSSVNLQVPKPEFKNLKRTRF